MKPVPPVTSDLDVAYDARGRQAPEADAGGDLEAIVDELLPGVEDLADVDERRDLELRVHPEDPHAEHLRAELGVEEQPRVSVEAILAEASQRVDAAQRGKHLEGGTRLAGDPLEESPHHGDQTTVEEWLEVDRLHAGLQVVGVAPEELRGRLGEHARVETLVRRRLGVAAVVDEGHPLGVDGGALDARQVREQVARERESRHAAAADLEPLERLAERKPHRPRDVHAEDGVEASHLERHVGLVLGLGGGPDPEEPD
jgi:hypothetical protein